MSSVLAVPHARDQSHGWCAACYAAGDFTPAVDAGLQACGTHLRLLPRRPSVTGQLQLQVDVAAVPPALRAPYATGEQQWCSDCVSAGRAEPRRGLAERMAGDPTPLCMTCWRSRTDRARRRGLSPEQTGWVADLQARLACETCGRSQTPAARPRTRQRRPTGDCWSCGEYASFLAAARAVHEFDQAQAARDVVRVDELRAEREAQLELVRLAGNRLDAVLVWQARVTRVWEAMPQLVKTGSHGRLQIKRGVAGWARAWWLLADFLARDAADRQRRGMSSRGRPAEYPWVVAVMAIDANYRNGAKSMAGLDPTAMFAGVSTRTVTEGWARTVEVKSTKQAEAGRGCTLEERTETGRRRQRAVYDFVKLHRSRFDPTPFLGEAAAVIAGLLQRAAELVDEHQALLEEARRSAGAAEVRLLDAQADLAERTAEDLQLQAVVSDAWADDARQALSAAVMARGRATRAMFPPADRAAVVAAQRARRAAHDDALATAETAAEQAIRIGNFCYHPRRGKAGSFTSGYQWGLQFSAKSSPLADRQRPDGRGDEHRGGASRPSPTRNSGVTKESTPIHHRKLHGVHQGSLGRPRRSGPPSWAKELAAALAEQWDFLQRYLDDAGREGRNARAVARERGLRLCKIATTLVGRLGPEWREHPDDVVRLVERYAGIFSVISPGEAHSPLAYLARMLDRALGNPHAVVPWPSPVRDRVTAAAAAAAREADLAYAAAVRTAYDDRDAAAARAGTQSGLVAARAAAAAAGARELPRPTTRAADPDDPARMAAARAGLAQHRGAGAAGEPAEAWPDTRQAGSGLPAGWRRGDA
jgi:hypothetical protein